MISPKICHCIHPFFREYAPVSTPSSYCIRYSVIKRYSVIVLYKMHIVQCDDHEYGGLPKILINDCSQLSFVRFSSSDQTGEFQLPLNQVPSSKHLANTQVMSILARLTLPALCKSGRTWLLSTTVPTSTLATSASRSDMFHHQENLLVSSSLLFENCS